MVSRPDEILVKDYKQNEAPNYVENAYDYFEIQKRDKTEV